MANAIKILEAAQEEVKTYDVYAKCWEDTNFEDDTYWQDMKIKRAKIEGLLKAYEIITGRKVSWFELESINRGKEIITDAIEEFEELGIASLL